MKFEGTQNFKSQNYPLIINFEMLKNTCEILICT